MPLKWQAGTGRRSKAKGSFLKAHVATVAPNAV